MANLGKIIIVAALDGTFQRKVSVPVCHDELKYHNDMQKDTEAILLEMTELHCVLRQKNVSDKKTTHYQGRYEHSAGAAK